VTIAQGLIRLITTCTTEIYMDQLRDLFWMAANRKDPGAKAPALQPLKDKDKGIVSIKGAIERKYSSAAEMLADVDDAEVPTAHVTCLWNNTATCVQHCASWVPPL